MEKVENFQAPLVAGLPCALAAGDDLFQLSGHLIQELIPILVGPAAEETQRRIPGTVSAVFQPSPISPLPQQPPNGRCESTGQMQHRGINRDHQIQLTDHRGRIGKVALQFVEVT